MNDISIQTKKYFLLQGFLIIISSLGITTLTFGQKPIKCKVKGEKNNIPKYKIADTWHSTPQSPGLLIFLSMKPEDFNETSVQSLARWVDRRYCKELKITVMIFDDRRIFYSDGVNWSASRGDIEINRKTDQGTISLSTERGKPKERIKIKFEPSKIVSPKTR